MVPGATDIGHGARKTRSRSSAKPARPSIWRLSILIRLTRPSTTPDFQGRVRPAMTAPQSRSMPAARVWRLGRSSWRTPSSHCGSRSPWCSVSMLAKVAKARAVAGDSSLSGPRRGCATDAGGRRPAWPVAPRLWRLPRRTARSRQKISIPGHFASHAARLDASRSGSRSTADGSRRRRAPRRRRPVLLVWRTRRHRPPAGPGPRVRATPRASRSGRDRVRPRRRACVPPMASGQSWAPVGPGGVGTAGRVPWCRTRWGSPRYRVTVTAAAIRRAGWSRRPAAGCAGSRGWRG